jgi:transposase
MKDTKYLSFRPIRHFTDNHIRVHAFYCVLALMLTTLLNKELKLMGHNLSIRAMLDTLQEAQQVVSIFLPDNDKAKSSTKISYSRLQGIAKLYTDKFHLFNLFS